eukprot:s159_g12.t1
MMFAGWRYWGLLALLLQPASADGELATTTTSGSPADPLSFCKDDPDGWVSSDNTRCCRYFVRSFCTSDGQYGTGWQSHYGTFNNWIGTAGKAADQACCVCGGGENYQCQGAACKPVDFTSFLPCDNFAHRAQRALLLLSSLAAFFQFLQ